jgi:hypothetical protein
MAKILSVLHHKSNNDPIETYHETIEELRSYLMAYLVKYSNSVVFIFGDGGSYFDDKPYPVNRMFIHESAEEILRFFDAFAVTTTPKDIQGNYNSFYFLFTSDSYEDAFDLAKDIALTSSTDFRL